MTVLWAAKKWIQNGYNFEGLIPERYIWNQQDHVEKLSKSF